MAHSERLEITIPYPSGKSSGIMVTQSDITLLAAMEALRISAVIPTHNRGHLVGRAVESVLRQSQRPAEIIVVDDGSTDDTSQQVASFGSPVRYVYQDNAGAAAARNQGVCAARSEWIAFLDSDDVWFEYHLERMAHAVCATSGTARFYFADALLSAKEGERRLWDVCNFTVSGDHVLALDATDWVMMSWPPMLLQSSVFKRASYLKSGGLWESLRTREDTHLFLRLGLGGPACAVAGCGVRVTSDDDPSHRLTATHGRNQQNGHWMQVLMYRDILRRATDLEPAHRRELRGRLAAAHRRLAYLAWREHRPISAAWQAGQSAILEPQLFCQRFARIALDRKE